MLGAGLLPKQVYQDTIGGHEQDTIAPAEKKPARFGRC